MRFADPTLLLLLFLIPAFLLLRWRLTREPGAATFSNLSLVSSFRPTWRLRYRWLPTVLRIFALAFLVMAIARPQDGRAESEVPGEGIDIALVMDTSSSMTATFGESTRMESAKTVLQGFIEGRKDDRLGLVIFRERSLILSPLTLDYEALGRLVEDVDKINLNDSTAIGLGLSDGINLLRESTSRSRVAILLTDGQNNAGTIQPGQAARIAETLGIRVYTIGLIERNVRGTLSSTNVDERALTEMAEVTGGRYFAAENEDTLQQIYENIDTLEKSAVGRPTFLSYDELAPYFLVAALLLLALEQLLRASVWRQAT